MFLARRLLAFHVCLGMLSFFSVASSTDAAPLTFDFSGVVQNNSLGELFPGKSIGDPYSGTFTVDPDATVVSSTAAAANYDGSFFDVTIEGTSYEVHVFNVWANIFEDGVEFDFFYAPGKIGALSLRSNANLYVTPDVPTSYDASDFDQLSRIAANDFDLFLDDRSSIDAISESIPEPSTFLLASLAAAGVLVRRRQK